MPYELKKLTPNLIVSDVERSVAFYRDVLGFTVAVTVPDASPYVFAVVQSGPVEVFLNAPGPAVAEYPAFKDRPIGGTLTLFIEVVDIARAHAELAGPGQDRDAARAQVVRLDRVRLRGSRRIPHHLRGARSAGLS